MEYQGLNQQEVSENQKLYGRNHIDRQKHQNWLMVIIKKLTNPFNFLLIAASILSLVLGQNSDFAIILVILLIGIVSETLQEKRAEQAAEKLAKQIALKANVIRENKMVAIDRDEVTVNDVVMIHAGSIVPADGQILEANGLTINQSVLTGESNPVTKKNNDTVFMGTQVVTGEALLRITAVGTKTEFGITAAKIMKHKPATEFEIELNNFAVVLLKITILIGGGLFLVTSINSHSLMTSLLFVLAVVIGFAPELLPMIMTINLSRGALKLSRHGVIIKYLPIIENFGSMDVICMDKTGTLTENKTVFTYGTAETFYWGYLNSFYQSSFKNPIDWALLSHKQITTTGIKKSGEIPFDFTRKLSSVAIVKDKKNILITKGDLENLLARCRLTAKQRQKIKAKGVALGKEGIRVIGVALGKNEEKNMKFVGILGFDDPPKKSTAEVIELLGRAGVEVKILTGDNSSITRYVCQEVGLKFDKIINGNELVNLSDSEIDTVAETNTIFTHMTPLSKEKIMLSLRRNHHTVGFIGDGINDGPSLKVADVGISVNNGTDVAKEAADMILLKKDLRVVYDGIIEGRKTFANSMKYILMDTSSTFGNMVSLAVASIVLPFLPLLPVQVLLNDLVYDFSQLLLTTDKVDPETVLRPQKWNIKFIYHFTYVFGLLSSVFDLATFGILYFIFQAQVPLFRTGWLLESIVTQTLIVLAIRTKRSPFWTSTPGKVFATAAVIIVIGALFLPWLPLGPLFHLVKPPIFFYALLTIIVCLYFMTVELAKRKFYHPAREPHQN